MLVICISQTEYIEKWCWVTAKVVLGKAIQLPYDSLSLEKLPCGNQPRGESTVLTDIHIQGSRKSPAVATTHLRQQDFRWFQLLAFELPQSKLSGAQMNCSNWALPKELIFKQHICCCCSFLFKKSIFIWLCCWSCPIFFFPLFLSAFYPYSHQQSPT